MFVTCISLILNSLCRADSPSWQIPALDDGGELTKVSHLGGLLPAHLHRLDQISQVDLCEVSQPKPVNVPVIHPLAELQAQLQHIRCDRPIVHGITQWLPP